MIINILESNGQLNFTTDNGNSGIIFSALAKAHISHESCIVYSYYDMTQLYQMGYQIEQALKNVNKECDKVFDSGCKFRTSLIEEQYRYAQQNLEKIHHRSRSPRFILCEWCGKLQHFLYGTMDADEARKVINAINNSSDAIIGNCELITNATHIIEAMLEEEEDRVSSLNEKVKQFYSGMTNKIDDRIKRRDLIDVTNEYKTLINSVEQAFVSETTGEIPKIIETNDFKKQIQGISKKLKHDKTFPIDIYQDDITEIFQFASVYSKRV